MSAHKRFFEENGYVVVPDLIPRAELARLREMIDGVLDGTVKPQTPNLQGSLDDFDIQFEPSVRTDPTVPRRQKVRVVFHLAHTHSFFWRHATRPEILYVVSELLGPESKYYTDQMFVKPPKHGSDVPFHQDSGYWPDAEPRLLSCWTAIDDATVENGCVHVIPGSHRRELKHHHFPDHPTQQWGLHEHEVDVSKEVPVEIKAGGCMFHHSLLVHRSFPNRSDKPRRGLVTIYLPADLKFHNNWPFKFGFKQVRGGQAVGV